MSKSELKPCPFCGGSDLDRSVDIQDREGFPVAVSCADCGAIGPWEYCKTKADDIAAITAWNVRREPCQNN